MEPGEYGLGGLRFTARLRRLRDAAQSAFGRRRRSAAHTGAPPIRQGDRMQLLGELSSPTAGSGPDRGRRWRETDSNFPSPANGSLSRLRHGGTLAADSGRVMDGLASGEDRRPSTWSILRRWGAQDPAAPEIIPDRPSES
jgi:hypothetical protein